MLEQSLPALPLRDESTDRTYQSRPAPVQGCGFALKPTARGGYASRLIPGSMVLVYVLRGEGCFVDWQENSHRLVGGDMAVMPAGKRHGIQQQADGQWAEAYVIFDGGFGDQLCRLGVLDEHVSVLHPGIDRLLVHRFEQILSKLQKLPDHALPSVLLDVHELINAAGLLHKEQRAPDRHQRSIDAACVLLSENLGKRMDIEAIASKLDMSYERFRKLFRQRVGVSPGDYRIRRRIDRARAMIWQHRLSNKEVAYVLGYPDPFTFSKQFCRVTGQWPDHYRHDLEART